ncbi:MAG: hypothetical protein WManBPW_07860 [Shewanella algae]
MNNEIEDYSLSEIFAQAKAIQEKKATDAEKLPALFDKVLDALVDTSENLNDLTARHRELQNLVTSEIADFFAGQEQPGEAVGAEAQHKALMARVVACFDGMPAVDIDELGWASFHAACVQKMAAARTKGRCGWNDPQQCSGEHLAAMLREHLGKGNQGTFEDVANFCMMLHQRGEDPVILRYPIIDDYGDAWYDGFMAAVKEAKSHDVECYTEADVLQLSEGAESEFEQRLAKKGGE